MKNLLLIVATGLVIWLAYLFWEMPAELFFLDRKPRLEALPTADSYMTDTVTRKYDADGSLAYVLTAKTGLYFSGDDRFELEAPRVVAGKPSGDGNPWHLTADAAHSSESGEQVLLSGNVQAWQELRQGRNEFFTDDILFLPGDNVAHTEARVKFVHPEGTTTGKGMKADFNREIYQLLAEVRGRYHVR